MKFASRIAISRYSSNPSKSSGNSLDLRTDAIKSLFPDFKNISIASFGRLDFDDILNLVRISGSFANLIIIFLGKSFLEEIVNLTSLLSSFDNLTKISFGIVLITICIYSFFTYVSS